MASIPAAERRTIVVTGFSKSYGLAGLRAGAILSPNALLLEMVLDASDQRSTVHGCNVIAQVAATAALNEAQTWLADFKKHLHARRDFTVDALNALPGVRCQTPQGCYVAFADITGTGRTASEIQEMWLQEARVAVVPGLPRWFGSRADGHIRISFATSQEILNQAFDRITHCMQS